MADRYRISRFFFEIPAELNVFNSSAGSGKKGSRSGKFTNATDSPLAIDSALPG
jgi:hypothetical protein